MIYMVPLVPASRYHIAAAMRWNTEAAKQPHHWGWMRVPLAVKRDLEWWEVVIRLTAKGSPIPGHILVVDPPPGAKYGDSDAAGGSIEKTGQGMGVIMQGGWTHFPWPRYVNSRKVAVCCGVQWRYKMSFLELLGHLVMLATFPEKCANSVVGTKIDTAGAVVIWKRG